MLLHTYLKLDFLNHIWSKVFCHTVLKRQHQVIVTFEPMAGQIFLTQDYFEALSSTNLKAQITENRGKLAIIFNVQQKKEYEILGEMISFAEKLQEIKARKAE